MPTNRNVTIGIVGSGGDGVVLLGTLIQHLAAAAGYYGQMAKYYGAQIRGGASAVKLNISVAPSVIPSDVLDILVCFNAEKYAEFPRELAVDAHTIILCDRDDKSDPPGYSHRVMTPFSQVSKDTARDARNKNIVAFGLLLEMLGFEPRFADMVFSLHEKRFSVVKENRQAYESGRGLNGGYVPLGAVRLAAPPDTLPRKILSGNEALVEAALSAGCRAYFFYPITPASEISSGIGPRLRAAGGAFRQTEDEIAMIMSAIGSSLAGAKSMIATSGPGFSLLSEALGLAVGMEVPVVIVDVQRCGPGTGVPTKSEQSDLFHAVFCGHGDAPRVVLAPHDFESVWRLTREGFNIAEKYQTPVIILSDQILGQTPVSVGDGFLNAAYPIVDRLKPDHGGTGIYQRYQDTPDGISPMAVIGDPGGVYQASGHSRGEDGSHNYSFEMLERWHEKIAQKLSALSREDSLVKIYGNPSASDRVITWGSSAQAVLAAVEASGLPDRLAVCVPELIAPFPEAAGRFVSEAGRLMVVELNYSAQFYRYMRSAAYPPRDTTVYNRSGAQPFSIAEIKEAILDRFEKKEVR